MPKPHVAVLDEELPFPLTSGKRIRTFNLLCRAARQYRLTYLCHRNPDAAEQADAERVMQRLGIRTVVVERRVPPKSGLAFAARLAANLFSSLPYSVASHRSAALSHATAELVRRDPPDLWHCEWTPYAETLREGLDRAAWVVAAHNVESLIWQRLADNEANPLKRWYIRRQFRKYERFERWAYTSCDGVIAVSQPDADLIRSRFGCRRVTVVDNGVDVDYFQPDPRHRRDPFRLLYLGSLDWRPNLDAARLLLEKIFPMVRSRQPHATLAVVGRKPPDWLKRVAADSPGVELHADVPDVRPFLREAGMLVVPLRIGGGSRLKILEALASGLPVISTTVGAEGLELENGEHLTIADSPDEFAAAILRAFDSPAKMNQLAEAGMEAVRERYHWDRLAAKMQDAWRTAMAVTFPLQIQRMPVFV